MSKKANNGKLPRWYLLRELPKLFRGNVKAVKAMKVRGNGHKVAAVAAAGYLIALSAYPESGLWRKLCLCATGCPVMPCASNFLDRPYSDRGGWRWELLDDKTNRLWVGDVGECAPEAIIRTSYYWRVFSTIGSRSPRTNTACCIPWQTNHFIPDQPTIRIERLSGGSSADYWITNAVWLSNGHDNNGGETIIEYFSASNDVLTIVYMPQISNVIVQVRNGEYECDPVSGFAGYGNFKLCAFGVDPDIPLKTNGANDDAIIYGHIDVDGVNDGSGDCDASGSTYRITLNQQP